MALSKEEILDAIASMSVLEVSELIKMMEEKFGVSAAVLAVAVAVHIVVSAWHIKLPPDMMLRRH